jgi:hypothetical protein
MDAASERTTVPYSALATADAGFGGQRQLANNVLAFSKVVV